MLLYFSLPTTINLTLVTLKAIAATVYGCLQYLFAHGRVLPLNMLFQNTVATAVPFDLNIFFTTGCTEGHTEYPPVGANSWLSLVTCPVKLLVSQKSETNFLLLWLQSVIPPPSQR